MCTFPLCVIVIGSYGQIYVFCCVYATLAVKKTRNTYGADTEETQSLSMHPSNKEEIKKAFLSDAQHRPICPTCPTWSAWGWYGGRPLQMLKVISLSHFLISHISHVENL